MAGKIAKIIDSIIHQRSQGNQVLVATTKTKLVLKGINPDVYTAQSEDDPVVIEKLQQMAKDLALNIDDITTHVKITPIRTAFTSSASVEQAVADIHKGLGSDSPAVVIFFASSIYDPDAVSKQMQESFNTSLVFGCTTAGEIASGKMLKNSLVAMAFSSSIINDIKLEVLENIKKENTVPQAFNSFEAHYKQKMADIDFNKYLGIILIDGLAGAEEKIMEKIGDLTNVTFIGGAAGDDLKFQKTFVFANGRAYTNAALLVLMKPGVKFDVIKTHSFCSLGKKLVVTKANEAAREVIEFNNKPAITAYAETLGVPLDKAPKCFMHNPVGLMIGGDTFVRSPQQVKQDGTMVFYCNLPQNSKLMLLESKDIIADTKEALIQKAMELGSISGIINFNCILRTLELEQKNLTKQYGALFEVIPTIGFNTYGEEYMGHLNQTATMIVFK